MKTIHAISTIIVFVAATTVMSAQNYPEEYLGLPGDNLNLYAVMNLFQESETLEKFEQSLNSEEQMINNLDLNGDGLIDYITVSDYIDGNVHNIVLRAALDRNEQQDVAVFVVENLSNGAVQIQLIGDEALYGPNYIVEPIYAETPNPGYTGRSYNRNVNVVYTTYYDIAAWPLIRFIYRPGYIGWRSSWYWGYYPTYWHPWRSHYWHYYYGYHYHWHNYYYTHYRHWDHYRCRNYTTYYRNRVRVYSPTVVVNINNGRYRNTYSRPDQRRAGEAYYERTASRRSNANRAEVYDRHTNSRSGTVANRQNVQRNGTSATRTRSNVSTRPIVSTTGRSTNATRTYSPARHNNVRTESTRNSQPVRSSAVQRSQPTRSSAVQRSQPTRSSTVQRSQPSSNRSSVQRSTSKKAAPSVQRSSSRSSRSSTVQRSQPTRSSSVQRSHPSHNRSSVKRSQPSHNRSSVKRSSSNSRNSVKHSSSSRSSGGNHRSNSTSRKR